MRARIRLPHFILLLLLLARPANAAWPADATSDGAPICTVPGALADLREPVPGASANVLVSWSDARHLATTGLQLYAQRLQPGGGEAWATDGVLVTTRRVGQKARPRSLSDGAGGMYVVWQDSLSDAVRAQHLDATGARAWGDDGILAAADHGVSLPHLASDGANGFFVAFLQTTPANVVTLRAQRVAANGSLGWAQSATLGPAGTLLYGSNTPGITLLADGAGGAIAVWYDYNLRKVRAQRVQSTGALQWGANGVDVSPGHSVAYPVAIPDGAQGAFLAWVEFGPGNTTWAVRAQRFSSTGAAMWTAGGVAITNFEPDFPFAQIAADGNDGICVGIESPAMRVQRVSPGGVVQWATPVTLSSQGKFFLDLLTDPEGGVYASWTDQDSVTRAQRVGLDGAPAWGAGAVAVFASAHTLHDAQLVAMPGVGVCAMTTSSAPAYPPHDDGSIFAKLLWPDGTLGPPAPAIVSAKDVRGDQGRHVAIRWDASVFETDPVSPLIQYRVWRRDPDPPAGATVVATQPWVLVAQVPPRGLGGYGVVAATLADSGAAGNPLTTFRVEAVTSNFQTWSEVFAYSVDDLAPASPISLPALVTPEGLRLRWLPSEDAVVYRVYRGFTDGFEPAADNHVATVPDTAWVTSAQAGARFVVVAFDVQGHASAPTWLPAPSAPSAGGALPSRVALAPPAPDPLTAGGRSVVRFELPVPCAIDLALFDVSGRRVLDLARGGHAAGRFAVDLEARGGARALHAGLYFVRLRAAGETVQRRLVVTP